MIYSSVFTIIWQKGPENRWYGILEFNVPLQKTETRYSNNKKTQEGTGLDYRI